MNKPPQEYSELIDSLSREVMAAPAVADNPLSMALYNGKNL